jgi:hypothetical protein
VVRITLSGDFGRVPPHRDRFEQEADAVADRLAAVDVSPGPTGDGRLPPGVRGAFERELPYDLSSIRLHTDAGGDQVAHGLGATAVTLGRDVSFAAGAYDPHSRAGRRLLAHEVVHSAQQGAVPRLPGPGPSVSRSPAAVPQRTAGIDADDSWRELISGVTVAPAEKGRQTRGEEASRRFRLLREGARLINSLWKLAKGRAQALRFRVQVWFTDNLPKEAESTGTATGYFRPDESDARQYEVFVRNISPPSPGTISLGGTTSSGIPFSHVDAESEMAETLHHELLHVEFVRAGLSDIYPTGHGSDPAKQTDPLFLKRETSFINELDALEAKIHREAKERQEQEEGRRLEEQRKKEAAAAAREPAPAKPEGGPSFVGAQAFAEGGAVGLGGPRGTAIVGADVILGQIYALHLGARGVYLSPDRLLAGGTVGLRVTQTGDTKPGDRVENPLFFDLEAGVLKELNPSDASRLTNNVALLGSASVGQEYGTSGTRFFWKLGGYVIISDRQQPSGAATVGGGATAGVGFRFQ